MKRKFRLTSNTDIQRVRRYGKPFAHPLVVLVILPNDLGTTRIGISAGRSVGNAVQRNRAKRQIREIMRPIVRQIPIGWDIVILARKPLSDASYWEIENAIKQLFRKSKLRQE